MTIIPEIVTQHAEDAAFLWLLRDAAVSAPHYSLSKLAHLDDRVEAHIDGLRIAGTEGWDIARDQLVWREAGEVFVAAVLALESDEENRRREVLEMGMSCPGTARGLISAMRWLPHEQVTSCIADLLAVSAPEFRRVGIAAAATHRLGAGRALKVALGDADPFLRARALRAVGQLGAADLLRYVVPSLSDGDPHCRFSAAWSAALLGEKRAIRPLQVVAEEDDTHREEAAGMALRRLDLPVAKGWQAELARSKRFPRLAVIGAGALGDSSLIPWLIEQMHVPTLARVAGEAFSMVTGVDLASEDLDCKKPVGFEAGPTDDPNDENVGVDPDEELPWPDPLRVDKWWHAQRKEFESRQRYLTGKPISEESLQQVLRYGRQRQRAAAAIELALLQPGQPLFEVRAPGSRQRALLGLPRRGV